MDPARYARVCELFDQADPLGPAERDRFLAEACGGDGELRAQVERMLAAAREPPLERPAARTRPAPRESSPAQSFALVHLVGRGLLDGVSDPGRLASAAWRAWAAARDEAARAAELAALHAAPAEEARRVVKQAVVELLPNGPAERRQVLAGALVELVRAVRAAPSQSFQDLRPLLPAAPPSLGGAAAVPALVLRVVAGPHAGRVFEFAGHDTFLVGRSSQAHFNLGREDRHFSRIHFLVEANPPLIRLLDMGSHNGTFVNGVRVDSPVSLTEGDRVQAGHTVLRVGMPGCLGRAPTETARPRRAVESTALYERPIELGGPCRLCNPTGADAPACAACRELMEGRPQPVPGYQIVRELGRGAMGVVYLAVRDDDQRPVALKTVLPAVDAGPQEVARFLREARILCELDHPNIVAFHEMGEAGGLLYFAMEYVPGRDAARLVKDEGPLPTPRAVDIVCQLLRALDYAHAKKFVHRDIKPANLLLLWKDNVDHVRLADFGLARVYQASQLSGLTMTGAIGGTLAFMPPEQVTNYRESQPPVDQYAAAATLYHLLTHRLPHEGAATVHEQLLKLLHDDPVPIQDRRPDLPDELAAAIHKALARDPRRRFADVKAFRRALVPFLRE
ncbi:MAG: FHA domain-containing serine/threonine-protein kinase [Gemmataceae bacterium]